MDTNINMLANYGLRQINPWGRGRAPIADGLDIEGHLLTTKVTIIVEDFT